MTGLESHKIKEIAVERFKTELAENLYAIVLAGSASGDTYKPGWSDLDLLIVVDQLKFDTKLSIANVTAELESASSVHHGVNVITKNEMYEQFGTNTFLEGKTLQALIDLKKYPDRLVYSRADFEIECVIEPDMDMIRSYSLSNIGMFLRRNRQTLTKLTDCSTEKLKTLLQKEIRAAMIITKLAVQYLTGEAQEDYVDVLQKVKILLPTFDFGAIDSNFIVIRDWQSLNNREKILEIFRTTDEYIEDFCSFILNVAKASKNTANTASDVIVSEVKSQ